VLNVYFPHEKISWGEAATYFFMGEIKVVHPTYVFAAKIKVVKTFIALKIKVGLYNPILSKFQRAVVPGNPNA